MKRNISWEAVIAAAIAAVGWAYTAGEFQSAVKHEIADRQRLTERLDRLEQELIAHETADEARHAPHGDGK